MNWLQPDPGPLPDSNAAAGNYTYRIQFYVPECVGPLALTGEFWADNTVTSLTVNGHPVPFAPCTPSNNCFAVGHGTTFTVPPAFLHGALNTLAIVVYNQGAWTGLAVNATLSSDCSGSENGVTNQCATLKVCKVAGPGVASGTPFTFGYTDHFGSGTGRFPQDQSPEDFAN